jgi:hypothetical protein
MIAEKFGILLVIDEVATAIIEDWILRGGPDVPVDQTEIAVLRNK